MRNDVLIMSVFHQETAGNNTQLCKAQFFIQAQGRFIGADYGIELQNMETEFFSLDPCCLSPEFHRYACRARCLLRHNWYCRYVRNDRHYWDAGYTGRPFCPVPSSIATPRMGLGEKEIQSGLPVQQIRLGEGDTVFNNFIPDVDSAFNIVRSELSCNDSHFGVPLILSVYFFENLF